MRGSDRKFVAEECGCNSGDSEDDDEVKDSMQKMKPNERPTMQLYFNSLKIAVEKRKRRKGLSPAYLPPCQAKPRKGTLGTATRELRTFSSFFFFQI
jgi:hypothetical protein